MTSGQIPRTFTLSWLRRIVAAFTGGYTRVSIDRGEIKLDAAFRREPRQARIEQVESVTFHRALRTSRLEFAVRDDSGSVDHVSMSGMSVGAGDDILGVLDAIGRTAALAFERQLRRMDERLLGALRGDRFIRRTESTQLHDDLLDLIGNAPGGFVRERISYDSDRTWQELLELIEIDAFTAARRSANHTYVARISKRIATEAYGGALIDLEHRLDELLSGSRYVYQADTVLPAEELDGVLFEMPVENIVAELTPPAMAARERLLSLAAPQALEARRGTANRYFCSALTLRVAAESYGAAVEALDRRIQHLFRGDSWLRASRAELPYEEVAGVALEMPTADILDHISPAAIQARERLLVLSEERGFDERRQAVNERFAELTRDSAKKAAHSVIGRELTDEQALAVVTDEDATLVLAGAGSGKTAVIAGKVAHLIENEEARPGEILVLAFNNKAVEELQDRLADRYAEVAVRTFHGFGKRIVDDMANVRSTVAKIATDEDLRRKKLDELLGDLLRHPQHGTALREYLFYNRSPYVSPFDFATRQEYFMAVRRGQLRTLSGASVRSHEELQIANFLTLNGIAFEYERKYEHATADREARQYEPDFYLKGYGIYIEHFAIDKVGEPPKHWPKAERDRYRKGIEWKRKIHDRWNTTMLETYSWQRKERCLRSELGAQLRAHGVALRPVSLESQLAMLRQAFVVTDLAKLLESFLHHFRSASITLSVLAERAQSAGDPERALAFLGVFEAVERWYRAELGEDIDFHAMISRATEGLRRGEWRHPYKYVLVDEFQDISHGRMEMLEALAREGVAFFVVGDDWQAIYRFAGSDVRLLQMDDSRLGRVMRRDLRQTFRYGERILAPSSGFVQHNPAQSQRELIANEKVRDGGLVVVAQRTPHGSPAQRRWAEVQERTRGDDSGRAREERRRAREEARRDIVRHTLELVWEDAGQHAWMEERRMSFLVLGRYNRNDPRLPRHERQAEFNTVHRAKGLEADVGVVVDLVDGIGGFPSQHEDDPLLDLVAPPDEPFSFAEERRLFYVALTRSRQTTYLLVDPTEPSRFVAELLERYGAMIRTIGQVGVDLAKRCRRCEVGYLVVSGSGKNMRCSNYPLCEALYPRCECGAGYLIPDRGALSCINAECGQVSEVCPECGVGIVVVRSGKYGTFWGCTEFSRFPPCRYRRNAPPQGVSTPRLSVERPG